jgi:hemolysin activation/secretion protein
MAKAYCSIGMLRSLLASIALLSPVLMADSSSAQTGTPAPNPVPPVLAQVPGSLTPAPRTLPSVPEQPIDRQPDKPLPENVLPTLPRPDELLPNPQNPGLPDESGNDQVKVKVTRFEILGSTVFTAAELAQITQPFVGQELTFAELLQVRSAITKLYVDKGYVTSGALIPPQTLKDGVVKIQIIEGSLQVSLHQQSGQTGDQSAAERAQTAATTSAFATGSVD